MSAAGGMKSSCSPSPSCSSNIVIDVGDGVGTSLEQASECEREDEVCEEEECDDEEENVEEVVGVEEEEEEGGVVEGEKVEYG